MREQFDRLQNLCDLLESTLDKEAQRRDADGERQLEGVEDEEEQGFLSAAIEDSLFEINRDFPRIVRYSLLVNMMSTTEACLVRLCRDAHRHLGISKFTEGGKDVIQRALLYLHNEAGLDTSRMGHDKNLADDLRNLRNAITHAEGCIKGRRDEQCIRDFVSGYPSNQVEIDIRDNIILGGRFVSNHTHTMRQLIITLRRKLQQQIATHAEQK